MKKQEYSVFLSELARDDKNILIMTAENRIFIKDVEKNMPDRLIDVGIAEQSLIGMAAGLAIRGKVPVCHCLAAFLTMRAFEFIRTDVGYQRRNVKLVGTFAGFLSERNGPTHQAIEDLSIMRGIPGMTVLSPSDEEDMRFAIQYAVKNNGPVYVRFNNLERPEGINHMPYVPGRGEVLKEGKDVVILSHGVLLKEALEAGVLLEKKGISTRVINMRYIKPINEEVLISQLFGAKLVVTLEDHFFSGGLTGAVSEILALNKINIAFKPITLGDRFFKTGCLSDIIKYHKMDAVNVANATESEL